MVKPVELELWISSHVFSHLCHLFLGCRLQWPLPLVQVHCLDLYYQNSVICYRRSEFTWNVQDILYPFLFLFCWLGTCDSSLVIGLLAHLYVSLLPFYLSPFIQIYYGLVPQSGKKLYVSTNLSDFVGVLPQHWHCQWPSSLQAPQFMLGFAGNFFWPSFLQEGLFHTLSLL